MQLVVEANAATATQTRIWLQNQIVLTWQTLRREAATYQPLYPEVQNLHRLYLVWLDARLAYDTFFRHHDQPFVVVTEHA